MYVVTRIIPSRNIPSAQIRIHSSMNLERVKSCVLDAQIHKQIAAPIVSALVLDCSKDTHPMHTMPRLLPLLATFLLLTQLHVISCIDIPVLSEVALSVVDDEMDEWMPKRRSLWNRLLNWDFSDVPDLAAPPTELLPQTYLSENQNMEDFLADYAAFSKMRDEKIQSGSMGNDSRIGLVMWHGMGDSGLSTGIQNFAKRVEMEVGGYVVTKSIVIGESDAMDRFYSYFLPIASQIQIVCPQLAQWSAEHNVTEWHAIGVSQGSQFLRAIVQQCGSVRISKLVSLGGQHEGIFGLPLCDPSISNPHNSLLCNWIRSYLELGAYLHWVQNNVVQAQYFHDPHDFERYTKSCIWLPKINNALNINSTYVQRISAMDALILVKFNQDRMVTPRESSHFEFYELGSDQYVVPLRSSKLYEQDRLGLRTLDKAKRLHLLDTDGDHLRYTWEWFQANVIPLLKRS